MRVVGNGCHLVGAEGECPPLPYLEVSKGEGQRLIGLGLAAPYTGNGEEASAPEPETEETEEPDTERAETILQALDLVEPEGLEPEGDREGKPTVAAIEAITGLADVTVEEIDAALAAHASA